MIGTVSVMMEEYTVLEVENSLQVCWSVSPPNITLERSVEFEILLEPETAYLEEDFNFTSSTIAPSDLLNNICADVSVFEDRNIENVESFQANLLNSDSAIQLNFTQARVSKRVPRQYPFHMSHV